MNPLELQPGQQVLVVNLAGVEIGTVHSNNTQTRKVDIYFDYPTCPHYWRADYFNILEVIA